MRAVSSAYVTCMPPYADCLASPARRRGATVVFGPGRVGSACLPRPAAAPVIIGGAECLPQNLGGCGSGHDDHGTDGDVLTNHCHAFVGAVLGQHLGVGAKVAEIVDRGRGHGTNS